MVDLHLFLLIGVLVGPLIWAMAITGPILWLLGFRYGPTLGLCIAGLAVLQVLLVSLLVTVVVFPQRLGGPAIIAVLGWPVVGPYNLAVGALAHPRGVGLPAAVGLVAAVVIGGVSALCGRHCFRVVGPTLATIAFFAAFIVSGELRIHLAIRFAAARLAPDCLEAGSWRHSIAIAGQRPQPHLHAGARKGADRYGWSHRANRFYRIPEQTFASVGPSARSWLPLPFPSCSP